MKVQQTERDRGTQELITQFADDQLCLGGSVPVKDNPLILRS